MGKWIKFIVSLAITVGCLFWTFKDTRWPEMWGSLRSANYWWIATENAVPAATLVALTGAAV